MDGEQGGANGGNEPEGIGGGVAGTTIGTDKADEKDKDNTPPKIPELRRRELEEQHARQNLLQPRQTRNTAAKINIQEVEHSKVAANEVFNAASQEVIADDPVDEFLGGGSNSSVAQSIPGFGSPKYTIVQQLQECNLDVEKATIVARDLFVNKFSTCKDIRETTVYHRFKKLAKRKDPVELTGDNEVSIHAFIFWVKEKIILGSDPTAELFPAHMVAFINNRATKHRKYLAKCERDGPGYKPGKFGKDLRWRDWADSFISYLKFCPGTDGIPLSYIIRDDTVPPPGGASFLKKWVATAPHYGDSFEVDAESVHSSLIQAITGNDAAEGAIQGVKYLNNGRLLWQSLVTHFEGQGLLAYDLAQADEDLHSLVYTGEKLPTMDWKEFERRLRSAFLVYNKHYKASYFHPDHKLSILLRKIKCDWLSPTLHILRIGAESRPPTTSFESAMISFRSSVQAKYPPTTSIPAARRIKALNSQEKGSFLFKPKGSLHDDDELISLSGGGSCHFHKSYWFPSKIFQQLPKDKRQAVRDFYAAKKAGRDNAVTTKRTIQELETENLQLRAAAAATAATLPTTVPASVSLDDHISEITKSYISQVSQATKSSIMGGRNEQAGFKRSKTN